MTLMPQVVKYSLISIQSFSPCRFWTSFKYWLKLYPRHFKFYQSLRLSIFWSKMTTTKKQLVNFDQFIKYHFILKYNNQLFRPKTLTYYLSKNKQKDSPRADIFKTDFCTLITRFVSQNSKSAWFITEVKIKLKNSQNFNLRVFSFIGQRYFQNVRTIWSTTKFMS